MKTHGIWVGILILTIIIFSGCANTKEENKATPFEYDITRNLNTGTPEEVRIEQRIENLKLTIVSGLADVVDVMINYNEDTLALVLNTENGSAITDDEKDAIIDLAKRIISDDVTISIEVQK